MNNFLGINNLAQEIFMVNKANGFWDRERNVGELLMLVTSELGEALEAHRNGRFSQLNESCTSQDKETRKNNFEKYVKDTFEDEIADAIIRLLDLSAGLGIDIEKHINAKIQYNKLRKKLHGKLY